MALSIFFVALSFILNLKVTCALTINPSSPNMALSLTSRLTQFNTTPPLNFKVQCDGVKYGRDLKPASCADAQSRIPTTSRRIKFGLRGRQGIDVATPWRWISSDGLCAIEVAETPAAQGTYLDLVTAADEMTQVCVDFADRPEGSIASNIGIDGKLALTMMSYRPRADCRRPIIISDQGSMDEILRRMPATGGPVVFGRRGVPGVKVQLPLTFSAMDLTLRKKLIATVDLTTALKETASWYDIWAETVAIMGKCVRDGRGGTSGSLGANGKIAVAITEVALTATEKV